MAVGDIVGARAGIGFSFRPAAGVQVMLTSVSTSDPNWVFVEDTTTTTTMTYFGNAAWGTCANVRIGITNDLWVTFTNQGAYTGIQIK
jgi:hypothetical protein|tara:strand:+ start:231 stop:494 length:264 start_codon:yes stop_codon:yes gene_type:complete